MISIRHSREGGNPVLFQRFTLLDAGSSPAWLAEYKQFCEMRHSLLRGSDHRFVIYL
jgi:hypothetical protein